VATTAGGGARRGHRRSGVGGSPAGAYGVIALGAIILVAAGLLLYSVWAFWPPAATSDNASPTCVCRWFGFLFKLDRERSIFVIVAVAGALGASLHALRSIARYVGEQALLRSWVLLYVSLPLVGGILGTVVYLVLRAGLVTGGGASQDPFGFAAVSALVGLFSAQAMEKLKRVFETLFTTAEQGADSLATPAPTVDAIDPLAAATGATITIKGSNFVAGATDVAFAGGQPGSGVVVAGDGASLQVVVPGGATTGPVTVTTPGGSATSASPFTVQ
jgi:hypothetical protein